MASEKLRYNQFFPLTDRVLINGVLKKVGTPTQIGSVGSTSDSTRDVFLTESDPDLVWVDSTSGNDGTGDGSFGNPYATYSKATTEIGIGNGTNVGWKDGTNLSDTITEPTQAAIGTNPEFTGTTISEGLCGFRVLASKTYSGSLVNLKACTIQVTTGVAVTVTGGLPVTIDQCLISSDDSTALDTTTDDIVITNTAIRATAASTFAWDQTGKAASANDIDFRSNSIFGNITFDNTANGSASEERFQDFILVGNLDFDNTTTAALPTIESGSILGSVTNAQIAVDVVSDDPLWVDSNNDDFRIQRESGYAATNELSAVDQQDFDSSLVGAALYTSTTRDMGAFNFDDSSVSDEFTRSVLFRKPLGPNIRIVKREVAQELIGLTGEVDVGNNVDRRVEEIQLQYDAITDEEIAFIDAIYQRRDTSVQLFLDPEITTTAPSLTVDGNQPAGQVFVDIQSAFVQAGWIITIANKKYLVVRVSPNKLATTTIVLDRDLEDNISDLDTITVESPVGAGDYKLLPQNQTYTRQHKNEVQVLRQFTLRFVRKAPRVES